MRSTRRAVPGNSSPVVWKDRIFLTGATKEKREVYCFDSATGKPVWQTKREVPSSWCTPIVIDLKDRKQIITGGDPWVIA